MLRQMLSGEVIEGDEAYEFTWVGKKAAIVEANRPIRKTLRPCPEESADWDTTGNLYILLIFSDATRCHKCHTPFSGFRVFESKEKRTAIQ